MIVISRYNQDFFRNQSVGSVRSAREIVPLVLKLVQPRSVIDVGCGVGTWLSVFLEQGVQEILGVDGQWVDKEMLQIPQSLFFVSDLTKQLRLNRQFDLVVSLEVAEHLPASVAETFIDSLVKLGPVVLFSAAIPLQKGVNHLNEQWPTYWVALFQKRNYVVVDAIRKKIWDNDKVDPWYAQNSLLFVSQARLESFPSLLESLQCTSNNQVSIVHPRIFLESANPLNLPVIQLIRAILAVSKRNAYILGKKVVRKILGTSHSALF